MKTFIKLFVCALEATSLWNIILKILSTSYATGCVLLSEATVAPRSLVEECADSSACPETPFVTLVL